MVNKEIFIEELIEKYPLSVEFLAKKGIKCIACGEPIWGNLEEACREKDLTEVEIDILVKELNLEIKMNKTV